MALGGIKHDMLRRKATKELGEVLDDYPEKLTGFVSDREGNIGRSSMDYVSFFRDGTPDPDALGPEVEKVHGGVDASVGIAADRIYRCIQQTGSTVEGLVERIGGIDKADPRASRILRDYNILQQAIKTYSTPDPDNLVGSPFDAHIIRPDIPNLTPETQRDLDHVLRSASSPEAETAIRAYLDTIVLRAVDQVFVPRPVADVANYASTPALKRALPMYRDYQIFEWLVNSEGDIPGGVNSVEEGVSSPGVFQSFVKMADELWSRRHRATGHNAHSEPNYYNEYGSGRKPDIDIGRIVEEAIDRHPDPRGVSWLRNVPEKDIQHLIEVVNNIRTNTPGIKDREIFVAFRSKIEIQMGELPEEEYQLLTDTVKMLWVFMGNSLKGEMPF